MTSIQVERKFGWQQEKHSLAEEKELGELEKKCPPPPCCCLFEPPCLIYFAVFSNLLRLPVYSGLKISCFMKDQLLGFIFNNYSSFVNPSLHLILCGDVFMYVKLTETWSLVMQLLISYWLNGYQENYGNYKNREWKGSETVFLQEEFCS